MIRAVLDPGVLIAGLLSAEGAPAQLIRQWLDGGFDLVACPLLIEETERTLTREKFRAYVSEAQVESFIEMLQRLAIVVADPKDVPPVAADPNDDHLVALARGTGSDVLVSGDKHLTEEEDLGALVRTPRVFLDSLHA